MKKHYTINCRGKLLDFTSPKVMGVINLNADSFYRESRGYTQHTLEKKIEEMVAAEVDIIDLGAMSSRPGAGEIDPHYEAKIISEAIEIALRHDVLISIDTYWSYTARHALDKGAHIINDISGGHRDAEMLGVVANYGNVPYIAMHMRGLPATMQGMTEYEDLLLDISKYFDNCIKLARNAGIKDVIIDPGFGFAKTLEQNYYLLKNLSTFKFFDVPILVGLSRKSMLYNLLDITPEHALNATSVANTIALMQGASILRVHDVREAREVVTLYNKINQIR